ncbi:hypothetical protein ACKI2C_43065 [Streptomyces brasiliscabiei]
MRERAIREVRTTGRPVAHVVKDLGIRKKPCGSGSARPKPTTASAMTG